MLTLREKLEEYNDIASKYIHRGIDFDENSNRSEASRYYRKVYIDPLSFLVVSLIFMLTLSPSFSLSLEGD